VKIITHPHVKLISSPMFEPHETYKLPFHGVPAENIIATAGKVCYDSYGIDGNPVPKHIRNLVDSGHHSVVEHVHVGLFIEGISRGCSHEIVRHRMFNYSQRSTRYTAEDDAAVVLDPYYASIYNRVSDFDNTDAERALLHAFIDQCDAAFEAYKYQVRLLEEMAAAKSKSSLSPINVSPKDLRKWCRGKARQLLPHALETRMVMTGNLRAWRHFIIMRTSRHAEAEIRRLAQQVFVVVREIAPNVFADLSVTEVDGFVEVTAKAA
jgi:thymidylate synthase (FAD)